MLALADNDIICKLVACGIFDQAIELLACTRADVRVLRESKWTVGNRAKPNSRHRKSVIAAYGDAIAREIGDLLESLVEIPAPSSKTDHLLVDVSIDLGERQILRVAYEDVDTVVMTSDKRALGRLVEDATCLTVRDAVAGRVVVFETVLLALITRHGFAWVADRVARVRTTDGVLRLAFSAGTATREADAVECLSSYCRNLDNLLRRL